MIISNRWTQGIAVAVISIIIVFPNRSEAQLSRERVETNPVVEDIFWGTTNVGIGTVQNVSGNNLKSTVMHTFGLVSGGADVFWGLDLGANTRLGLDYGITDKVSVGIGRMTFNKVVDIRSKVNVLRQTESGSVPLDVAVKLSTGISTLSGRGLAFSERLSYLVSLMAAKKFDRLSFQLAPMFARFNRVSAGDQNNLFGLGFLTQYELNERFALSAEYLPVLSDRNLGTEDMMALSLNINTGGHIFQIFFSSSQWHGEQYIMANNSDKFWEGDFRFGFNINRVFGL
ncbi:DUF5777 family beta-barrel protein [Rhodohalobacter sp. 8-1]|uniref:DUF5777 family beta-barrel protein n=1 Tax=Rhodohalobacter sp. 8-1 TaxID=3131972 RepID=UPI0030EE2371